MMVFDQYYYVIGKYLELKYLFSINKWFPRMANFEMSLITKIRLSNMILGLVNQSQSEFYNLVHFFKIVNLLV